MDDNAYLELMEEEWNDPSAVDYEDIREQLEIDKTNFSPFVVSDGPDKIVPDDEEDLGEDDELMMEGDIMDLEPPIRDAIVLDLPINPLCSDDCPGLCPECGGKWAELPADHAHEVIDARWAGLNGLDLQ